MKYKSLLIRLPPDLHDALTRLRTERHINISAWVRSLLARELARELGPDRDPPIPLPPPPPPRPAPPLPPSLEAPLPGWRPHRLDNGDWGSIYLGDPAELVGATIVVQSRNGQSWTTTVTAVLDRSSEQVIRHQPRVAIGTLGPLLSGCVGFPPCRVGDSHRRNYPVGIFSSDDKSLAALSTSRLSFKTRVMFEASSVRITRTA